MRAIYRSSRYRLALLQISFTVPNVLLVFGIPVLGNNANY